MAAHTSPSSLPATSRGPLSSKTFRLYQVDYVTPHPRITLRPFLVPQSLSSLSDIAATSCLQGLIQTETRPENSAGGKLDSIDFLFTWKNRSTFHILTQLQFSTLLPTSIPLSFYSVAQPSCPSYNPTYLLPLHPFFLSP